MTIKKNDYILVTRAAGNIQFARATKVGPWSKNPKIVVVNYKFIDDKGVEWSSRSDARVCVVAPHDHANIPKAIEAAAVCPTMAMWSFGKERKGPLMREGYYFASPIFYSGKKVGVLSDDGNGGQMRVEMRDFQLSKLFIEDCRKWSVANGGNGRGCPEMFYSWWFDGRPKGFNAQAYLKEQEESLASWAAGVNVTTKGNFAEAVNGT